MTATRSGPRADPARAAALQGARAIAASAVVALHAGLYSRSFEPGMASGAFVRHFDSAVPLFLVLSGFVLYSPFAAAHADGRSAPRLLAYARRRVLRIFPAYWVVLAGTGVVFAAFSVASITPSAPASLGQGLKWVTLTALWLPGDDRYVRPVAQSWTLDVEASFYVVLPVLAGLVAWRLSRGRRWFATELSVIGAAVVVAWAYKVVALRPEPNFSAYLFGLPVGYFDAFAIGMGLAVVMLHLDRGGALPRWAATLLGAPVMWAAWLVLLVLGTLWARADANSPDLYVRNVVYVGLAVFAIVPIVVGGRFTGLPRRVLSSAPLQFLGTVSYGIYLWHFFVFDVARRVGLDVGGSFGAYLVWCAVGLGGAAAMGTLSWYLVERPAIRLGRRGRSREVQTSHRDVQAERL